MEVEFDFDEDDPPEIILIQSDGHHVSMNANVNDAALYRLLKEAIAMMEEEAHESKRYH